MHHVCHLYYGGVRDRKEICVHAANLGKTNFHGHISPGSRSVKSSFLFDSIKELKLVKGAGSSCILSMKTDSAVALKQLNTQLVTVRPRTAAQKLTYLRELVYQVPQVEPGLYFGTATES